MSDFWAGSTAADPGAWIASNAADAPSTGSEARGAPWCQEWIAPGPKAEAFYWDDADVCLLRGPVGSGKTTANLRKPFRRALTMPRSVIDGVRRYKVVIARATYRQLWQTTIPSWFEVVPRKMGSWAGGRGDPVTHTIRFEDDHGTVEFVAEFLAFGESPSEIEANVRGVQTTDFLLEEADTVLPILFITAVGRIDRFPAKRHFEGYPPEHRSYGQINATYNAPEEGNWILALEGEELASEEDRGVAQAIEDAGVEVKFYRQPGAFEPGAENMTNLSASYYPRQIAIMKAAGQGHEVERLVHNRISWRRDGDPVFEDHFNERVHVSAEPMEPWRDRGLLIGLDQGFFGAAVIAQFRPPFQWRFYAELVPGRSFARVFGGKLRELLDDDPRFAGMHVAGAWGDMAGEAGNAAGEENQTWNEIVSQAAGIVIEPQMFGGNRVEPRLNAWRAAMDHMAMGQPGLLIDPSCRLLIRGLAAKYVWEKEVDASDNRKTRPKKKGVREADVIDAGGYLLLSEASPDGLTPMDASHGTREADHRPGAPLSPAEAEWDPLQGIG